VCEREKKGKGEEESVCVCLRDEIMDGVKPIHVHGFAGDLTSTFSRIYFQIYFLRFLQKKEIV